LANTYHVMVSNGEMTYENGAIPGDMRIADRIVVEVVVDGEESVAE
jgi:hypothetical protein